MRAWKPIRTGLAILLVAVGAAIIWSFLSRQSQETVIPKGQILAPDITQKTEAFEFTQSKKGRPVFRVRAATSTIDVKGVQKLQDASLQYYDQEGRPSDSVAGKEATYRQLQNQIEFSGDVRIGLADGTRLFADRVSADLAKQVVVIDSAFRFVHQQATGGGQSMTYYMEAKRALVVGPFNVHIPRPSGEITAEALNATYDVARQKVDLIDEARIAGEGRKLSADRIAVLMTPDRVIENIFSSGNALLQTADGQSFAGTEIHMYFRPETRSLNYFDVVGSTEDVSDPQPATYRETSTQGDHLLEASRIVVSAGETPDAGSAFSPGKLTATPHVVFRSTIASVDEFRADNLEGTFYSTGELRELEMRGNVSGLKTQSMPDGGALRQRFESNSLNVRFLPGQIMDGATAVGDVKVQWDDGKEQRRLSASDSVKMTYQKGVLQKVLSSGQSVLESIRGENRMEVRSPWVRADYSEGLLRRVLAGEGVRLDSRENGQIRHTTSKELELSYRQRVLQQAVQTGDFHLWDQNDASSLDVVGEKAVYDPATQVTTVSGERPAVLNYSEKGEEKADATPVESRTFARRFELNQDKNQISAFQNVRSVVAENDGTVIVTAGRMDADTRTGWVDYSEDPEVIQEESSIKGNNVRFNSRSQTLIVEGNVRSMLVGPESQKHYRVEADQLNYDRRQNRARYEGQVQVVAEDLTVAAPHVDLFFNPEHTNAVNQIVAWGGVEIVQEGKKADADRAVYYPDKERITLSSQSEEVARKQPEK